MSQVITNPVVEALPQSTKTVDVKAPLKALGLGLLVWVAAIPVGILVFQIPQARALQNAYASLSLGAGALLMFIGAFRGVWLFGRALTAQHEERRALHVVVGILSTAAGGFLGLWGAFMALWASSGFARGRQLRSLGKPLLPVVERGAAWAAQSPSVEVDPTHASALAAQWRENGQTEHASVGAFARLTLDLMALGAPPKLVADSNRDALDEIRHTQLCFSLARSLDQQALQPGPFPAAQTARTLVRSRKFALAQLAVDSLVDGALHEGLSARVIARLVKRCEEPTIRAILKQLAMDEGRHAAHGWDVVEWCLEEGGDAVAYALQGALLTLPTTLTAPIHPQAADGSWERYGVPGRTLEEEEFAKARDHVIARVHELTQRSKLLAA